MNNLKIFIKQEVSGWKKWEVLWLLVATIIIASLSVYWGDNWFGIISALTGVWCVILTGKGKRSCYIFGLINCLMYAWISFQSKYYGEVMLNATYYPVVQFVGWYAWSKNMNNETAEVNKERMNTKQLLFWIIISFVGVFGYGLILKYLNGNFPFFDSFTTVLSVIAAIISVKRYAEQWIIWILVDIVTVGLWYADFVVGNSNIATLLMWSVYLLNAFLQAVKWYKDSKNK